MKTKLHLLLRLSLTLCVLFFIQNLNAQLCQSSFSAKYISGSSSLNCISTSTSSSDQYFYGDGMNIMEICGAMSGGPGTSDFFYCANQNPGPGSTPAAGWYSDTQNHLDRFYYWDGSAWDQSVNGGDGFVGVQSSPCLGCVQPLALFAAIDNSGAPDCLNIMDLSADPDRPGIDGAATVTAAVSGSNAINMWKSGGCIAPLVGTGWFGDASSGNFYYWDNTATPQWDPNPQSCPSGGSTYTVTFNVNGGSGSPSSTSVTQASAGASVTLATQNTLSKTGNTFSGWNTASDGTGTNYSAGSSYTPGANITLYAKWTADTYTVSYNANSATSGSVPSDQTKTYGVNLTLRTNSGSLARTGYTFAGWNTAANGSGTSYSAGGTYSTNAADVLYAEWAADSYTLTYDANSGNVCSPSTKSITYASTYGSLCTPTRTGYTFSSWNTQADGNGSTIASGTTVSVTADQTIYAIWAANSYSVIFDNDGGSGSMSNQSVDYGVAENLTANSFTRTGYTFGGWATSSGGSAAYTDGQSYTHATAGNVTLYAVWTANSYSVIFDNDGGSGSMSNQSVDYGVAENLTANSFTRTGYTFGGWATSSGGSAAYTDGQSYTHATAGNVTLYAVWAANSYSVIFDNDGGSGSMSNQSVDYGVAENLTANSFTRTGYTFGGWATSSGGSAAYTDGQSYTHATAGNVTLYAVWTANSYSVIFDNDGGSGSMSNQSVDYGVAENLTANSFTRTGYTFGGWATSSGGSAAYTDGQSYTHATAGNVTLYAVWAANSYSVIFDNDGGSGSMSNQSVDYGVAENLTANSFTRTGYTFGGWATSSGGSAAYTDGQSYTTRYCW